MPRGPQSKVPDVTPREPPAGGNEARAGISRRMVLLLAAGCGLSAANLYYAQPLLHTISRDMHTGSGTAGLMITLAQLGYALGLGLIVPIGDIAPRKALVPAVLIVTAAALAASAAAGGIAVLIVLAFFVGIGSVAAQVIVPFAASAAGDQRRGQVVGAVMSGLLVGILLARTLSGIVAGAAGWRVVYAVASGAVLVLAAVLRLTLPREGARPHLPYRALLASTVRVFAGDGVLRLRALLGALAFAGFSIFWTTVAFVLAGPPYRYSDTVIGLFGLAGAAGALCASMAGRLSDRGWTRPATIGFAVVTLLAWLPLWIGGHHLVAMIAGIVVLDIGVQGTHVTNQGVMFSTGGDDRSRANAAYMVCYFVGGAAGSATAAALYSTGRWPSVAWLGAGVAVAGILGSLTDAGGGYPATDGR